MLLPKYNEIRARRARGEKGFTLIELLVVVVIIGILVAIAIPVYLNYQNNAKKKSTESDVRSAISTVEMCLADNDGSVGGLSYSKPTLTCDAAAGTSYTVNVSDGTELTITPDSTDNTYTIVGTQTNVDPDYVVTYDSADGSFTKS